MTFKNIQNLIESVYEGDRDIFFIEVKDKGKVFKTFTASEFRSNYKIPSDMYISDAIDYFNKSHKSKGLVADTITRKEKEGK